MALIVLALLTGGPSIYEAINLEQRVVVRRFAIQSNVGQHFADNRAEFESVSAEAGADKQMTMFGVGIHNKMLVRGVGVQSNAAFAKRRLRQRGNMRLHKLAQAS